MLSGPHALEVTMFFKSFSTPSVLIVKSGSLCRYCFSICGMSKESSIVNTDLNCSTNIWAFSLLSLNREPSFLSGEIPILSCFLDLTYLQNGLLFLFCSPSLMTSLMWFTSASLNAFLHWRWNDLNSVHCLDFFACLLFHYQAHNYLKQESFRSILSMSRKPRLYSKWRNERRSPKLSVLESIRSVCLTDADERSQWSTQAKIVHSPVSDVRLPKATGCNKWPHLLLILPLETTWLII